MWSFYCSRFWFLYLLEPGDQVIADWGFKTKTDFAIKEYASCIAPIAAKWNQMTSSDMKKSMKYYKHESIWWARNKTHEGISYFENKTTVLYLLIFSDIVRVFASLANLKKPLVK